MLDRGRLPPTLVFDDGGLYLVAGSPMGTMIITAVMHSIINVVDFGMNPQQAVDAPRFHHQWRPDRLTLESGFPVDVQKNLEQLGHAYGTLPFGMGAVQLILVDRERCYFWAGVDRRRDSAVSVFNRAASGGFHQACSASR